MSILTAEKIFIDQKEEITFVIDRVLASDKSKVIFIIPQGALILSSPISIKILFKEVAKLKKSAIVVTEDDYGIYISEKVGFVVASKVSQITGESWAVAKNRMETFLEKLVQRKKELSTSVPDIPGETEDVRSDKENNSDQNTQEGAKIAEDSKDVSESEVGPNEDESIKNEEDAKDLDKYKKTRAEAKVIDLDGIEMVGGGDIKKLHKQGNEYARIDQNLDNSEEDMQNTDRVIKTPQNTKFTGKDFTRVVKSESKLTGFFSKLFSRNRRASLGDSAEDTLAKAKKRKIMMIIGGVVGVILLILFYLLAFEYSSVDVRLRFKSEEVPVQGKVQTNPNITQLNTSTSPIQIPAQVLLVDKVSSSWTGQATGQGKKGVKAKGFLDIYNIKVQETINLPVGTKATSETSGKVYILTKAVTLDPATVGPGGVTNAFFVQDVPIEAVEVGADYNVAIDDPGTRFIIDGYDVGDVRGTRVRAIEGGSSTDITVVSQSDIDKLKDAKLSELKTQAETKLRNIIPNGSFLIPETIDYKETNVTSVPKVNAEAPADKTFSLTVEMTISGYSVKNDDLSSAGKFLLTSDKTPVSGSQVVVDNLKLPVITKVEKNSTGYTLSISSQGSVGLRPSEDDIRSNIQGKSLDDVNKYFDTEVPDLQDYKIYFSPGFIPAFLQRIPDVSSRVSIKIN